MQKKYFLEMIRTGNNTLMHVRKWKDVNEGVIYKSSVEVKNGNGIFQNSPNFFTQLYADYYGQCWSRSKSASEILWLSRCSSKPGVCIKTTVEKLKKSISRVSNAPTFVKEMRYVSSLWLNSFLKRMRSPRFANSITGNFSNLAELLFMKREEFSDEKEVRLLVVDPNNGQFQKMQNPNCLKYRLDKTDFLTEVIFDPRMGCKSVSNLKKEVQSYGWTINGQPIKMTKSPLYEPISGLIRIG